MAPTGLRGERWPLSSAALVHAFPHAFEEFSALVAPLTDRAQANAAISAHCQRIAGGWAVRGALKPFELKALELTPSVL
jgi:hypothetical protein